ncbi:hypothetical protein Plec18167_009112 [Paecilomyces lecythidis]|uniref:Xylanolytic transcriptional activator regulatory domain-containing protein n=1 Tax=Paecilomyces lecythidis TaxID=3004212 RepID=A0ABR3WS41_9EURO
MDRAFSVFTWIAQDWQEIAKYKPANSVGRPCVYRSKTATKTQAAPPQGQPSNTKPLPGQRSDNERGGQTISFNQHGHLKANNGLRLRYYSSSSWVASVEESDTSTSPDDPYTVSSQGLLGLNNPSLGLSSGGIDSFVQSNQVDRLISWYSQYCHFWFPVVDVAEIMTSLQDLRNQKTSSPGATAIISALCYAASCSVSASNNAEPLSSIPSSSWRNVASQLLFDSGYPSRPNLNTIRAAFLLAAPSMAEGVFHPDPGPICVLVRAAQSLGLHREPMSFQLSAHEAVLSRILWWSIRGLDTSYAVAHALPPLIHPTTTDVQMIDCEDKVERKLLKTIIRTGLLISSTFHNIYGVRQPTFNDVQRLDEESEKVSTEEVSDSQHPGMTALERFVAMSRRMCCCKMLFILHQPYLRTPQWPQSSRIKALNACQDYIGGFLTGVTDHALSPYRWVLEHFDVIHPCAILLQDLIQHPGSLESDTLRNIVETCFSTFSKVSHPDWARLERLRSKAWAANCWNVGEQTDLALPEGDVSLADWDPLFASFIWEELLT